MPGMAAIQNDEPANRMELYKHLKAKSDKDGKIKKTKTKNDMTNCGRKATGCEGKAEMKKENSRKHNEMADTKVAAPSQRESKKKNNQEALL